MFRTEPYHAAVTKAPCAMVPLKPKELRRPTSGCQRKPSANTSVGISNDVDTIEDRCVFSLRPSKVGAVRFQGASDSLSCAFIAIKHVQRGTSTRETNPAAAADASRCPMFDFKDAHCTDYEFTHKAPMAAPT